ncbi:NmrA family transcriptional regulator [Actinomadura rugatobispora]|uniref:NmrA family transcriptional regulator n=1 Tax=Actinomadura rugatobispora TaxID=1994 RepID=A0ABW0ZUX1_9ACTN|nr:NAD(P)H-binding protein [Actinomadura rugatobispora]
MAENTRNANGTTLVLGGRGKTGRRVVERLEALGLPVRVGSRAGTPPFEWKDRSTWGPVLEGVGAVYLAYYPDLTVPGAVEDVGALSAAALEAGAGRIVLLSGRGEEEAAVAERALIESGAEWTVLRASWFAQNFSEDYLLDAVREGVIAVPAGDVPEPFADADDIADVAVAALTGDGHAGRIYEITGRRALTFAEAAAEIGTAAGREVAFVPVPVDRYAAELKEHGVPDEVADLLTYLFGTVLDGRNSLPADGVRQALGREPRDFADFARDTAATGVWDA